MNRTIYRKGALSRSLQVALFLTLAGHTLGNAAVSTYTPAPDPHNYGNVRIGGGGWVSGLSRSPTGVVYARTDVGGAYRLTRVGDQLNWEAVTDKFSGNWFQQPVSIGFDPKKPNNAYIIAGETNRKDTITNVFLASTDNGKNFTAYVIYPKLPSTLYSPDLSGNGTYTKNTGDRIAVSQTGRIYIGTETGVYSTTDYTNERSWERNDALDQLIKNSKFKVGDLEQTGYPPASFIKIGMVNNQETIFVGFNAYRNGKSKIFRSTDGGSSWAELTAPSYNVDYMFHVPDPSYGTPPDPAKPAGWKLNDAEYFPLEEDKAATKLARASNPTAPPVYYSRNVQFQAFQTLPNPMQAKLSTNGTLYVTMGNQNRAYGAVWRLLAGKSQFEDITPNNTEYVGYGKMYRKFHPYTGIEVLSGSQASKDTLLVITGAGVQRWKNGIAGNDAGSNIYQSISGGLDWRPQFVDAAINGSPTIECNFTSCSEKIPGNQSWLNLGDGAGIHNSGGLVVDPSDHKRVYITSGDGVWGTKDILWNTPYRINDPVVWMNNRDTERSANSTTRNSTWSFAMDGIEVLVPLDMAFGKNNMKFSAVTDYGLFKWSAPDVWAVRDIQGRSANRAIANAVTDRGIIARSFNRTNTSLLFSRDNGETWTTLSTDGLKFLDQGRQKEVDLRNPVVMTIVMSQDGKSMMTGISGVIYGTPKIVNNQIVQVDSAVSTWYQSTIGSDNTMAWNRVGLPTTGFVAGAKITPGMYKFVADQAAPNVIYGFIRDQGTFVLSTDRGANFELVSVKNKLPRIPSSNNASALAFPWNETADVMATYSTTTDLVATPRRGELWICFNEKYTYGAGGGAGLWRITGADKPATMRFEWKGTTKDPRAKQFKGIFGANLSIGAPNPAMNPGPTDYALYAFNATMLSTYDPANLGKNDAVYYTRGDFRSDDYGVTWYDISDAQKRTFGGTGNAGAFFMSPVVFGEGYRGSPGRGTIYVFRKAPAVSSVVSTGSLALTWLDNNEANNNRKAGFSITTKVAGVLASDVAEVKYFAKQREAGTETYGAEVQVGSSTNAANGFKFDYTNLTNGIEYSVRSQVVMKAGKGNSFYTPASATTVDHVPNFRAIASANNLIVSFNMPVSLNKTGTVVKVRVLKSSQQLYSTNLNEVTNGGYTHSIGRSLLRNQTGILQVTLTISNAALNKTITRSYNLTML